VRRKHGWPVLNATHWGAFAGAPLSKPGDERVDSADVVGDRGPKERHRLAGLEEVRLQSACDLPAVCERLGLAGDQISSGLYSEYPRSPGRLRLRCFSGNDVIDH
jgi:hypothetical protein